LPADPATDYSRSRGNLALRFSCVPGSERAGNLL